MNSSIKSKIVAVITIISGQEIVGLDRDYIDIYNDRSREFGIEVSMGDGTWYRLTVGTNEMGVAKYSSLIHFAPTMDGSIYSDTSIDIARNYPQALPHWEELVKDIVEYLSSI